MSQSSLAAGPAAPQIVSSLPATSLTGTKFALFAAALFLLRVVYAPFINLFPEEAYYWNYARHLDYGYLDHPPLVAWLIRLGTTLFGDKEIGVRLFALGSSLVAAFFAYRLAALFYGRVVGTLAALLMQVLPIFFLTGCIMTPDAPLIACWAGTLYFLARVFFERRAAAWLGVGVFVGLGMITKYTIALLGPATLLFLLCDRECRFWLRHAAPYGATALALLIFSPVIIWNATHHWASFAFQSAGRVQEPLHFSLHALLGSVLVLLTPLGVVLAGRALAGRGQHLPAAPPDASAAGTTRVDAARRLLFARVFTLVPLSVFVVFSLIHPVKLNWTGPLWLAVLPMVAAQIAVVFANPTQVWLRRGCQLTAAACVVTYLVTLQHLAFGVPGLRYSTNIDLLPVAWRTLGQEVEHQAAELRSVVPEGVPVRVVGMDRNFIASELAFYHSQPAQAAQETLGSHLFAKPSLMYGFWFPSEAQNGATLLLVSFERRLMNNPYIEARSRRLGEVQTHSLQWHGQEIRRYYTRAVSDYHSTNSPAPGAP